MFGAEEVEGGCTLAGSIGGKSDWILPMASRRQLKAESSFYTLLLGIDPNRQRLRQNARLQLSRDTMMSAKMFFRFDFLMIDEMAVEKCFWRENFVFNLGPTRE